MRIEKWMALVMILSLIVIAGCPREVHETKEYYNVTPNVQPLPHSPSVQPGPIVNPGPVPGPGPQPTGPNVPAWANETRQAQGQSAVNPRFASNPAQARLMAKRGAILDARRNLLEQVLGLQLSSETVVRDMVTESDKIESSTNGLIRNSYEIGEHFDGSIYTVTMELKLYDVYLYMKTQRIYYE